MADGDLDRRFAERARELGLVSEAELLECLDLRVLAEGYFGRRARIDEVLFLRGRLTIAEVRAIHCSIESPDVETRRLRPRSLFGRLAIEAGYLTLDRLLRGLEIQAAEARSGKPPRPIGSILFTEGYLTREQVEEILRMQDERSRA